MVLIGTKSDLPEAELIVNSTDLLWQENGIAVLLKFQPRVLSVSNRVSELCLENLRNKKEKKETVFTDTHQD